MYYSPCIVKMPLQADKFTWPHFRYRTVPEIWKTGIISADLDCKIDTALNIISFIVCILTVPVLMLLMSILLTIAKVKCKILT